MGIELCIELSGVHYRKECCGVVGGGISGQWLCIAMALATARLVESTVLDKLSAYLNRNILGAPSL